MPDLELGLLYKLLYQLTFYDVNWGSLDSLTIQTTSADVIASKLRLFRLAQMDRMLCRENADNPYSLATCCGIEVVYVG